MEKFEELKDLIDSMESDVNKFYEKGNKSAGTRVRKLLQEVKKAAQALRVDIQDNKKTS